MYYGVTIGPIVETLQKGKKTVEIWAASYMFSSFMKKLAGKLNEKSVEFIIPYVDKNDLTSKDSGIGMYHDRLIFKSDKMGFDEIDKIINEIKDEFAEDIMNVVGGNEDEIKKFVRKYIKTYVVAKECENPILEIYKILDDLEYNEEIYEYKDYIDRFLIRDNILKSRLLKKTGKKGFESIPQIASKASGKDFGYMDDDSDYYKKLQDELKEDFKHVYKYIAIVHADGDRLGNVVKSLKFDENKENPVSKALFDFGKEAKIVLNRYSCNTIFIGGDDLLFFAPVVMNVEGEFKTVFDLLEELKKIYLEKFGFYNETVKDNEKTTLSFGLSITYYKFPLTEALNISREALFAKAKSKRNAVALVMQKHSGQKNEMVINFSDERYEVFKNMLRGVLFDNADLPFSIHFKLKELEKLLNNIEEFDAFFENYFNEDIHKQKFQKGLKYIQQLIEMSKKDDRLEIAFPAVNIIKLLKGRK